MDRIPEPTNDHERTIAEAIESKLALNSPYESIVAEVVVSVPFDMSIADTQFLFNYAHWRLAQPVKKQLTRGVVPDDLKRSG
jgi:hypothetical protein